MSEWISVDERLPEHGQHVLCYQSYPQDARFQPTMRPLYMCFYQVAEFKKLTVGYGFIGRERRDFAHVHHWMPLPEPPKEKGNS